MKNIYIACVLLIALFLSSCASNPVTTDKKQKTVGDQDALELIRTAVQKEVIPKMANAAYLREPTLIISGRISGQIGGKIDGVTRAIRDALMMELWKKPGYSIVRRHRLRKLMTPGVVPRLICGGYAKPENYLIINTRMGTRKIHVDMGGFEIESGKECPVSGISFTIEKNQELESLYNDVSWDEYLEGTRYLPIPEGNQDAIAAYLGYNAVCVLRDIYLSKKNLGIYVDETGLDSYEIQVIKFLKGYLNQYGLPVVKDRNRATHIFEHEFGRSGDIVVLWVSLMDSNTGRIVPYTSTKVFYKKSPQPLSLKLHPLGDNYFCVEVQSKLQSNVTGFRIMEGGRPLFPNSYSRISGDNYRVEGNTAILDFTNTGAILLGGESSPFRFYIKGSGSITAHYSVNNQHYSLAHTY